MRSLDQKPPLPAGLASAKALTPLFAEHDERLREAHAIRREIEQLTRDADAAREADKAEAARAFREGKPDSGNHREAALGSARSDLGRRAVLAADARELVIRDIELQLTDHGEAWALEAEGRVRQAKLDAQKALDAYKAARLLVADLEVSARWLRSGGNAKPLSVLPNVVGLPSDGYTGNPYHLSVVLTALEAIDADALAEVEAA